MHRVGRPDQSAAGFLNHASDSTLHPRTPCVICPIRSLPKEVPVAVPPSSTDYWGGGLRPPSHNMSRSASWTTFRLPRTTPTWG
eukprot:15444688-Alexandrium_andersonii.AAC.1